MSLLETLSGQFARALATNASRDGFLPAILPRATVPGSLSGEVGFVTLTEVLSSPNALEVWPLAEQVAPGQQFSMRVWAWNAFGDDRDPKTVWAAELLVELLCTVGNLPGPFPQEGTVYSPYSVTQNERFCDTITLSAGDLGNGVANTGFLISPGPGYGAAKAKLALTGPRRLQFDFDTTGANAYWRRA